MKSERVLWIDALKGFAMICVILGHMQIPKVISQFCFAFHMPLFFFVSGYLYVNRHPSAAWILRKIDGLLVPYVIYSSIFERLMAASRIRFGFCVLMVAMSVLFPFNSVDMSSSKTGNIILFYGTGCSIIILLSLAFNKFQVSNPILVYVGRNSLLFLAMSQLIPPLFRLAVVFVGFDLENGIVKCVQRILTLGCVIGGVELCNRYLPVLSGRLKIFSQVIEGKQ